MAEIRISWQELNRVSADMRQLNEAMHSCLEEMASLMSTLQESWESDASSVIRQKFLNLKPHFERYAQVIEGYAAFLEQTAENYQLTEAALEQNAESFQ